MGATGTKARRRRTQQERSAATQDKLLDATIDCIVELGYGAASTTVICERAGVSRGAQVHHYPTKASLVAAAIERLFARRHEEFRRSLARQPDLDRAFGRLWTLYRGPTLEAWMELLIAARTDPPLRDKLAQVDERFFAEAQLTCRRLVGVDEGHDEMVAALTRMILSVFDGLALNRMLGHPERRYQASLAIFQQAVEALRGAQP
ncbi:MAG: TetR/AcrR family transcriptional regulator [Deltaproteobacteria bacterium]|nr:TetR/AcrR family transcriptional regulator [Deltaproteobacteria bacterium]MBW2531938.1 TetR/AcrR family transcriptional regulator [Deltaproteobacteria bacterium]